MLKNPNSIFSTPFALATKNRKANQALQSIPRCPFLLGQQQEKANLKPTEFELSTFNDANSPNGKLNHVTEVNDDFKRVPTPQEFDYEAYRLHNHKYIQALHEQLGDIIRIPIEGKDMVFVRNPMTVKRVLTQEEEFDKTFADADTKSSEYLQYFKNLVQPLFKSANIFGSGDNSSRRSGLKPVFLASDKFLPLFDQVLEQAFASWPTGRLDLAGLLHPLVFRLVAVIISGETNMEGTEDLLAACQSCLKHFENRYSEKMFQEQISHEDETHMKAVEDAAMILTQTWLRKFREGNLSNLSSTFSMLAVMNKFGLSEVEMNATMVNALFAACEAPIHVLASTLVEVSKQPALQKKLVQEMQTKSKPTDSKLLHQTVMEGLRLHAPVTLVQRRAIKDLEIDGYFIPKYTTIGVCITAVHANEKHFPDAMKFDPTRKLNHVMFNKSGFMPFSGGPRGCPGRHLAATLLKSSVGRILERFQLGETTNSGDVKIHKFVEFPSNGAFVYMQLRSKQFTSRL